MAFGFGMLGSAVERTVKKTTELAVNAGSKAVDMAIGEDRKNRMVADFLNTLAEAPGAADLLTNAAAALVQKVTPAPMARLLESLCGALDLLKPEVLLTTMVKMTRTVVKAILKDATHVFTIRKGVLSNELTGATIQFLWDQRHEVVNFLVDVIECAKGYVKSDSLTGKRHQLDEHGLDNELDLRDPMNRHALLCQVQRLVKSVVYILTQLPQPLKFEEINMTAETQLLTDSIHSGAIVKVTPSGSQILQAIPDASVKDLRRDSAVGEMMANGNGVQKKMVNGEPRRAVNGVADPSNPSPADHSDAKVTDEKWIFVNGIGTELYWLHLACKKLAKRYSRDVTGVYNRGDGILWDLIECAGQRNRDGDRNTQSQENMVQTTASSKAAQKELVNQLENALMQAEVGNKYKYVVMIAHSQGCLVLRLALETLLHRNSSMVRDAMRNRLCVFTFGNPSVDWHGKLDDVLRTEHFANEKDFVAKLGVLKDDKQSPTERGFDNVFVNREKEWVGHLFGTQYSLKTEHYTDDLDTKGSKRSWLLNCREGESLDAARKRLVA
ncbi:uncharacterized protein BKCO1_37000155 [Diplodia corticola]|uniref:Uncharacterized protein n=1 Tax=Diplodia corticola TaxID=236234 RepID=A0A1J9QUC1_9PEZI|nr:uncharacterized protein BKCO1_37000155 [Diplodia corticola]OJD32566.1 hypothetical protein BKCO1_37000155 [Diplodia corticola]